MWAFDKYRCDCEPYKPELYENQKHVIMGESKTEKKTKKTRTCSRVPVVEMIVLVH